MPTNIEKWDNRDGTGGAFDALYMASLLVKEVKVYGHENVGN